MGQNKGTMKRLCIYVTYDFENSVDDYVGYMLSELCKVVDCLVVVCNYEYIAKGIENVRTYADKVYYRENKGFDAGAYKDALCRYLGWDEVCQYDELLLVNDSFYGPLYPIEDWFYSMEKTVTDYWGIIKAPRGKFADGFTYGVHIQSYFLAFRKNVFESECFHRYWEQLEYPVSLYEAVKKFEIGCNKYLEEHGFKGTALTEICHADMILPENQIPYMQHSLELIRDYEIPILKRTSLYFSNNGFNNALEAFKYIESKKLYDTEMIKKHLTRISCAMQNESMLNNLKLSRFCKEHEKVYFYGAGVYGQNLSLFFTYMGWKFDGFVVTSGGHQKKNCKNFKEIKINSNDGFIIAVGKKDICLEILETLKKHCREEQILYPNF